MKKWVFRTAAFMILVVAVSGLFLDRELSKMFGGHTQIAKANLADDTPPVFALSNVNVLAPSADRFINGQTVTVENGTITNISDDISLSGKPPTIIDGNGMFLVSGYTDSHVHLWESENDLLLYVANGVTQIREMNGSEAHLLWREQVQNGRIGPDMFIVGPQFANFGFFSGWFHGWTQNKLNVRSAEHVEQAVQSLKGKGFDAVKASSFLDEHGYQSLSQIAANESILLVGHIPMAVGLDDLWASNQSEVAHIEEFSKALNREFGGYNDHNTEEFLEFVRERSPEIADRLLANGISVTTTIWLMESLNAQKSDLAGTLKDVELQYANPGITEGTVITSRGMGWLADVNIYRWNEELNPEEMRKNYIYWRAYAEAQHILLEAMLKKGVPIMAGTDANVPVVVPGFSLHDEILSMNRAGMTAPQVLAAVTTVPAEWMNMNAGQIVIGHKANLVLLRDNPLDDIGATDSIEMVILNGRVLSRDDLDEILLSVLKANDFSRSVQIQ